MSDDNERPPLGGTDPGPDEPVVADGARAEPTRPAEEPGAAPIVRWSARHSEAARTARTPAATNSSNGSVPDSIVRWSPPPSDTARTAVAGEIPASKPARSNAAGPEPARSPAQPVPTPRRGSRTGAGALRPLARRLAKLIAVLGWLIALLMLVYILFVVLRANPVNPWAAYVESWAPRMNLGLGDLVAELNPTIRALINYGIAAVLWAIIGTLVSWLIRRIAAP